MNEIAQPTSTRERLRKLLDKVPRAVNNGSHNQAVAYKKWVVMALKKVANTRTTETELVSLEAHYNNLNKETLL